MDDADDDNRGRAEGFACLTLDNLHAKINMRYVTKV